MKLALVGAVVLVAACSDPNHDITVTFAGDGRGYVTVELAPGLTTTCTQSCIVQSSTNVRITAYAASTLVDINGCLADNVSSCYVPPGDEAVVYFGKEPNEIDSLFTRTSFTNGAIMPGPDMDLVLGSETTVTRMGLDGAVRWELAHRADDIKVASTGDIYVRGAGQIVRVDPDGQVRWMQTTNAVAFDLFANGDVAVVDGSELAVLAAADGSQRWTVPVTAAGIAVHHGGSVAVTGTDAIVKRFDSTGAPLTDWTLPAGGFTDLAVGANDELYAQIVQPSVRTGIGGVFYPRHIARFAADGTVASVVSDDVSDYGFGFAVGAGDFEWKHGVAFFHTTPVAVGTGIVAHSPNGTNGWELAKHTDGSIGNGSSMVASEFIAFDAACNGSDACAVFGQFRAPAGTTQWVQVFRLPSS